MFQSLELLFLICLFLAADWTTGEVLPPRNLSLRWINDFQAELSWIPPQHSMENCSYQVCSQGEELKVNILETKFREYIIMDGRSLWWAVRTDCDTGQSAEVRCNDTCSGPVKVVDVECYIYAANQVNCSWFPSSDVEDLRFFYQLQSPFGSDENVELQECSLYTGAGKTGCSLKANTSHVIHILLKGRVNNTTVRNTFSKHPLYDVRPPPLKWNITKHGDKLRIAWTPPEILPPDSWSYTINYNICDKPQNITVPELTSYVLDRVRHCPYCMTMEASSDHGRSPPSEEKCFDADEGPNLIICAMIFIPLGFFCLMALTLVFCRRKRKLIFPRIPIPRDFVSETVENSNKRNVFNHNSLMGEEDICIVTVLLDDQIGKSDCRNGSDVNLHFS